VFDNATAAQMQGPLPKRIGLGAGRLSMVSARQQDSGSNAPPPRRGGARRSMAGRFGGMKFLCWHDKTRARATRSRSTWSQSNLAPDLWAAAII